MTFEEAVGEWARAQEYTESPVGDEWNASSVLIVETYDGCYVNIFWKNSQGITVSEHSVISDHEQFARFLFEVARK